MPVNKELTRANEIIESYGGDQSKLIAITQEIQAQVSQRGYADPDRGKAGQRENTSSRSAPVRRATSANPSLSTTPSMAIWA